VTLAKLVPSPEGIDATSVECPTCGAWVGWACLTHADGYHILRIRDARLALAADDGGQEKKT